MRRFLSWITMIFCQCVVLCVLNLALYLIRLVLNEIHKLSTVLYWAAIIIGGMAIVGILVSIMVYGSFFAVRLSQLVWKSEKGTRYIVFGALSAVGFAITTILCFAKVLPRTGVIDQIVYLIASVIFLFMGKSLAEADGAPPSKREILQAKLAKLDAKEAKNRKNTAR